MKSLSKLTIAGIALFLLSPIVGLIGTVWCIYRGFGSMVTNESAGIGAVGGSIFEALLFTIGGGIIGTMVGIVLFLVGIRKTNR